ncbi:tyrosine-type recombinase/integrase [Parablautia intestinalis]|uniref:tyrosine-type recombinase/integrase n=1 Tax=Parablautia intestinalis TaxID=2320100 RepID=UPI0024125389|nr:tyrosine-type recombinase/integrase [Parablautia intestinalis]
MVVEAKPEVYLFYSRVGGKYVKLTEPALDKRIKMYAADAHKKCLEVPLNTHAHQFRHAKAIHWLEDGMNIIQNSFLLGHASLVTTMRYLDITTDDKRKALATLEGEKEKNVTKKWKDGNGSLADYGGIPLPSSYFFFCSICFNLSDIVLNYYFRQTFVAAYGRKEPIAT